MYVSSHELFAYSLLYSISGHFPNRLIRKSDFIASERSARRLRPSEPLELMASSSLTSLNQIRMLEERAVPKNVTAQEGLAVYLHCIVEPVGDKMVVSLMTNAI